MDVAPAKKIFTGFSPASTGDGLSLTATEASRKMYALFSLVALALVLRLYAISLYPLGIDEYGSIWEAKFIGLNWNSIIYSILMHFWVRLGSSELWLRLPAAIFGTATVPIIFKIGEKLGGRRTALLAGLLAAVSPFSIYHSQEVRFYSLFIFSSAAFMLATISFVDSRRVTRNRLLVLATGLLLLVSHFLGILALYAQGAATVVAIHWKKRLRTVLVLFLGPVLIFGLPIIPFVRHTLLKMYQVYAHASNADVSASRLSLINFAKLAFAGYTFVFGYHVYPLRLVVVIAGLVLTGFLIGCGVHRLWQRPEWRALPFTYLLALVGVYMVLDSIGGRVATGVSPRHVAFFWPALLLLLALGLSSFRGTIFKVLLVALLSVNAISLWYGWRRDWTYGVATDYRSAAAYAATWADKDSALISDGRSYDAIDFYFPKSIPRISSWPGPEEEDLSQASTFRRLIVVTNDWRTDSRQESDELMRRLSSRFTWIDGRVEYPMFEYVLERQPLSVKPGYSLIPETGQLRQPLSFYGAEFQDLRLPVSLKVEGLPLQVVGAYELPNSEGSGEVTIPLAQPAHAGKAVLVTDIVGLNGALSGQTVAEVIVESKSGAVNRFPLRLDRETASWAEQCQPDAECQTVFQWHKRIAMTGQNSFSDAWRDFPAGLHAVVFDLPPGTEVTTLKLRYLAASGHLYVWGIAFPT